MKKTILRSLAAGGAAVLTAAMFSPAVSAQTPAPAPAPAPAAAAQTFQVNLTSLNKSGASGSAVVTLSGTNVTFDIRATGLSPGLAHLQHVHIGGQAICPSPTADTDKDGFVSAKEAEPFVGPLRISLTASGDTAAGSATALDRYPKADTRGQLTYKRTFAVPAGVTAADMSRATIDLHGISTLFNDKAKYDGDKKSTLDSKLPFETTVPAACGKLNSTPTGSPNTGIGSTAGIESPGLLAFGAAALAAAVALAIYSRRPLTGGRS